MTNENLYILVILGVIFIGALIFLIFINMCFGCTPTPEPSPHDKLNSILNTYYIRLLPYLYSLDANFDFNEYKAKVSFLSNDYITTSELAKKSGLKPNEICLTAKESFKEDARNWQINPNIIKYVGKSDREVYLAVYCSQGTELQTNLNKKSKYLKEDKNTIIDISECECINSNRICCVIGLVK